MRWFWLGPALFTMAVLMSGCSDFAGYQYVQYGKLLDQAWNPPSRKVSLEEAAADPYASIGVEVGGGQQVLLVLATTLSEKRLWTSNSHIVVETQHGRIVSTGGLAKNLSELVAQGPGSPKSALEDPGRPQQFLADFADLGAYSVRVICHPQPPRPARIKILGQSLDTLRITENCSAKALKWDFTDRFWLDPKTNMIWQSVQHVHPNFPAVRIEVLRPAA